MNRPRSVSLALAAVAFVAAVGGAAWAEAPAADGSSRPPTPTVAKAPSAPADGGKSSPSGLFLRLSLGAVYLHESWNPSGGSPGAVFSGAGPSLELSIGKRVRPRLVVGGLWQFVAVSDTDRVVPGNDVRRSGNRPVSRRRVGIRRLLPEPATGTSRRGQRRSCWRPRTSIASAASAPTGAPRCRSGLVTTSSFPDDGRWARSLSWRRTATRRARRASRPLRTASCRRWRSRSLSTGGAEPSDERPRGRVRGIPGRRAGVSARRAGTAAGCPCQRRARRAPGVELEEADADRDGIPDAGTPARTTPRTTMASTTRMVARSRQRSRPHPGFE